MFDKVLIANRGAIACRIIRTLRRLSVSPVAVYSQADAHSLHVSQADEAICIGEALATETYLDTGRILDAARRTGAQAIHPGYGFLSENAAFAEECERRGIAFIGPTPQQLRDFGLKHTARSLAEASGVPMLPGTGLLKDVPQALGEAAARRLLAQSAPAYAIFDEVPTRIVAASNSVTRTRPACGRPDRALRATAVAISSNTLTDEPSAGNAPVHQRRTRSPSTSHSRRGLISM